MGERISERELKQIRDPEACEERGGQMGSRKRILPPEVLLEEYRELLKDEEIKALPLVISGNSMSPFLIHGRDTVYLSRLERPVRRGDVLLYRRDNGAYILHRVCRVEKADGSRGSGSVMDSDAKPTRGSVPVGEEVYTMIGDAQVVPEPGIRRDQVIAIMTSAERKGRRQAPGCFWWEFFEKVWIRMIPVRRLVRGGYTVLTGLFRRAG